MPEQLHDPSRRSTWLTGSPPEVRETVEAAFTPRGGPAGRRTEVLRGTVSLPKGSGKRVRVVVFAQGDAPAPRRRPAPTSSAPRTSSPGSRAGSSSSTCDRDAGPDGPGFRPPKICVLKSLTFWKKTSTTHRWTRCGLRKRCLIPLNMPGAGKSATRRFGEIRSCCEEN